MPHQKATRQALCKCKMTITLLVPDRPGNKLAYGHLNILKNPRVGLIFMIPGTSETLRINGDATLTSDPVTARAACRSWQACNFGTASACA